MCDILAQGQLSLDLPNLSLCAVDAILVLPLEGIQKKTKNHTTSDLQWLEATGINIIPNLDTDYFDFESKFKDYLVTEKNYDYCE